MTRGKMILLAGATALALMLAYGCSLLPREESGAALGYSIKLRIQTPAAAKGITVGEFDVTGLHIEVLDPAEQVLVSIEWVASDGPTRYDVPVPQPGLYRIVVTHMGGSEEDPVQATEEAAFEIRAMKITVIDVVPGGIGLVWIPEPISGSESWQPYGTWANEEYNGWEGGPAAKVVAHESGVVELYRNTDDPEPFETAQFLLTSDWTDPDAHWFRAIAYGSVHILFRISDGGNTMAELISDTDPDPGDLDPSTGNYDVIYYRQE